MPYITNSGVSIPQGTDAFSPPTQFKTWADKAATYENRVIVATTSERDALASPVLRVGLCCFVVSDGSDGVEYVWTGSAWAHGLVTQLQLDTTNSVVRTHPQCGIGKITGTNSSSISETVTFPVPFTTIPTMSVVGLGSRTTGTFNPASLALASAYATVSGLSATGFTVTLIAVGNLSSANDYYYSWAATGTF